MAQLIKGLKNSEILRIESTILELVEKFCPEAELETSLKPAKEAGKYMMTVRVTDVSFAAFNQIPQKLSGIIPKVFGKGKSGLFIMFEGRLEHFQVLLPSYTNSSPTLQR